MTGSLADNDDEAPPPVAAGPPSLVKQRVLLAVVIILGVAIVVAFAILVVGLVTGAPRGTSADGGKPWAYTLDVAPGTRIDGVSAEAGRVVVRLTGPQGEDVVLIDAANGKVVGRIHVAAHP